MCLNDTTTDIQTQTCGRTPPFRAFAALGGLRLTGAFRIWAARGREGAKTGEKAGLLFRCQTRAMIGDPQRNGYRLWSAGLERDHWLRLQVNDVTLRGIAEGIAE